MNDHLIETHLPPLNSRLALTTTGTERMYQGDRAALF